MNDLVKLVFLSFSPFFFRSFQVIDWLLSLTFGLLLLLDPQPKKRRVYQVFFLVLAFFRPNFFLYHFPVTFASYKKGPLQVPLFLLSMGAFQGNLSYWLLTSFVLLFSLDQYRQGEVAAKAHHTTMERLSDRYTYQQRLKALDQDLKQDVLLARQEDRERIVKDLHTSIGHSLSAAILTLHALSLTSKDPSTVRELQLLEGNLKQGLTDVRSAIYHIYDSSIDLEEKLHQLLTIPGKETHLIYYEVHLSRSMKEDLYILAKECISNFIRHSSGQQLTLRLIENKDVVSFSALDNGPVQALPSKFGIGLATISDIGHKYHAKLLLTANKGFGLHLSLRKEIQ